MPLKTIAICVTSPDLFCNIHIIQLQHTSKTYVTIEIYNYNMREREPGPRSTIVTRSVGVVTSLWGRKSMSGEGRHRGGGGGHLGGERSHQGWMRRTLG